MVRKSTALIAVAAAVLGLPSTGQAAFPGDNGRIAFVSNRGSIGTPNLDLFTMNPDGSDVRQITSGPDPDDNPAWSPDGSKIAYESLRNGFDAIVVTDSQGNGGTVVTGFGTFLNARDPSWSPDGRRIAFQAFRSGTASVEIYTINSDGTGGFSQLTNNAQADIGPSWSPDGSQIAFSRFIPPCPEIVCNHEILVMNADGTNERRLTFDSDQDTDPNWSPDGRKIIWGNLNGHTEIQVMNADGSGQSSFEPHAFGYEPAWSPDGRQIVWSGFGAPSTINEINVMNADGSGQHPISNSESFDVSPDWQPIPNRPPDCSGVTASRQVLTTHNRRLVAVSLDGATDPDGDPVTITIDGVTQDEPVTGRGDNTSPDAVDEGEGELRVRAERSPRGDGRVYRIAFTVSDGRGGSCSGTATVSVPRKKRKPAVDSAPPSYDSFGGVFAP